MHNYEATNRFVYKDGQSWGGRRCRAATTTTDNGYNYNEEEEEEEEDDNGGEVVGGEVGGGGMQKSDLPLLPSLEQGRTSRDSWAPNVASHQWPSGRQ